MFRILIPREREPGETRAAATPETVAKLTGAGASVEVEADAGAGAFISDADFEAAGASVCADPATAWREADAVLTIRGASAAPEPAHELLKEGALLVGLLDPLREASALKETAAGGAVLIAMELVPRITRAQKMDVLSSQASLAGYKAVLMAAAELPKHFPLLMTAAGTIKPARVVVMGAGVAGLQAIATARRLGAVVEASDIRPAVREQVESLGAKFIDLPESDEDLETEGGYAKQVTAEFLRKQQEIAAEHVARADVVITTALVPGKKAPTLLPAEVVARMKPGSVIVDMAVAQGGNCELSRPGENVREHGVLIIGHPNLPATMPADASMVYARNVLALLSDHIADGELKPDFSDEVLVGCVVSRGGRVVHPALCELLGIDPPDESTEAAQ